MLTPYEHYPTISNRAGIPTKTPMVMCNRVYLTLVFAIALSGCGGLPISSDVPEQLEILQPQVTVGQTSRHEVHERLGRPFISSERWSVEVYRVRTGHDVSIEFALIPFWIDTEEVIIYALVVYDDLDIVKAISWDVYRHIREHHPSTYLGTEFRSAKLHAGDFYFAAAKEGLGQQRKEWLLAPASATPDALHTPPSSNLCAVLFFFYQTIHSLTQEMAFFLDDQEIGGMPLLAADRFDPVDKLVFSKVLVAEGEHELRLTTLLKPDEFQRKFICEPGSIIYLYPQIELTESEPWELWGQITVNSEPIGSHEDWRRLLFYNGKWLGDD